MAFLCLPTDAYDKLVMSRRIKHYMYVVHALEREMSYEEVTDIFVRAKIAKPGPKGPSAELVHAIVEIKQRNPRWGCPRIAEQITLAFNLAIDKDVVRRILDRHHWPGQSPGGPSCSGRETMVRLMLDTCGPEG